MAPARRQRGGGLEYRLHRGSHRRLAALLRSCLSWRGLDLVAARGGSRGPADVAPLASIVRRAVRRDAPGHAERVAHATDRNDRLARDTLGLAATADDARARGPPPLADRHLRGSPGLAGARYLRALRRNHRQPATRSARSSPHAGRDDVSPPRRAHGSGRYWDFPKPPTKSG